MSNRNEVDAQGCYERLKDLTQFYFIRENRNNE